MSDVFAQVKICERNRRPPILSIVLFGNVCIGLLLEAQEQVTYAYQGRDFKLHNSNIMERYLIFARLALAGYDKLKTI